MYSHDKLYMRSLKCYFGAYFSELLHITMSELKILSPSFLGTSLPNQPYNYIQ